MMQTRLFAILLGLGAICHGHQALENAIDSGNTVRAAALIKMGVPVQYCPKSLSGAAMDSIYGNLWRKGTAIEEECKATAYAFYQDSLCNSEWLSAACQEELSNPQISFPQNQADLMLKLYKLSQQIPREKGKIDSAILRSKIRMMFQDNAPSNPQWNSLLRGIEQNLSRCISDPLCYTDPQIQSQSTIAKLIEILNPLNLNKDSLYQKTKSYFVQNGNINPNQRDSICAIFPSLRQRLVQEQVIDENDPFCPPTQFDTLVDQRDQHPYLSIRINNQIWMAENLNYGEIVPAPSDTNSWAQGKLCANILGHSDKSYCQKLGGLYNWDYAMQSKICPNNYHLPTTADVRILDEFTNRPRSQDAFRALVDAGFRPIRNKIGTYKSTTKLNFCFWLANDTASNGVFDQGLVYCADGIRAQSKKHFASIRCIHD